VLQQQFARAKSIVAAHRLVLDRVAEALLDKGRLSGEDVRQLGACQPGLLLVGHAHRWVH